MEKRIPTVARIPMRYALRVHKKMNFVNTVVQILNYVLTAETGLLPVNSTRIMVDQFISLCYSSTNHTGITGIMMENGNAR